MHGVYPYPRFCTDFTANTVLTIISGPGCRDWTYSREQNGTIRVTWETGTRGELQGPACGLKVGPTCLRRFCDGYCAGMARAHWSMCPYPYGVKMRSLGWLQFGDDIISTGNGSGSWNPVLLVDWSLAGALWVSGSLVGLLEPGGGTDRGGSRPAAGGAFFSGLASFQFTVPAFQAVPGSHFSVLTESNVIILVGCQLSTSSGTQPPTDQS